MMISRKILTGLMPALLLLQCAPAKKNAATVNEGQVFSLMISPAPGSTARNGT
jgi:hypothetical protein